MNTVKLRLSGRLSFGFIPKKFKPHYESKLSRVDKMRLDSIRGISGRVDRFSGEQYLLMGLSSLSNSEFSLKEYKRGRRGTKGMTGHGRLLVKDAATWLQKEYGRERVSFWTLTVPPECLNQSLISQWSRVIELLKKKLINLLTKLELPTHVLGVSEIQPSRWLNARSVPPLHLHILFIGAKHRYKALTTRKMLDKLWMDCLENFSGVQPEGNFFGNVQFIRKDASGYMAKYMSKGSYEMEGLDATLVPRSWYFCTKSLRDVVRGLMTKASGEWVNELYQYLRSKPELFRFSRSVEIPTADGHMMVMGWYGEFASEQTQEEIRKMIVHLRESHQDDLNNYQRMARR